MDLPKISSYGLYSSSNYGAHCLLFEMDGMKVWFSYQTVIAFETPKTGLVVSENCWGPTTGKHLNWISSHRSHRVKREEFERLWHKAMTPPTDIAKAV